ncbi:glycoside hydrolase family 88 protein [Pedobacter psychrophilus]|nr:glycoside hydrolase family 88 protein [Pedobacter psychrophilus]
MPFVILQANVLSNEAELLDSGKTTPFNWAYHLIDKKGISFNWSPNAANINTKFARFRISTATDVREPCVLEVLLNKNNFKLGEMDLSYATYLQVYELQIPQKYINDVLNGGITLKKIKGEKPIGVFAANDEKISKVFKPHLLLYDNIKTNFDELKRTLLNREVYQPFGWMEGVVMDGLQVFTGHNPEANSSLYRRFKQYFTKDGFNYTGLYNTPIANTVMNVETVLPFALYAQYHPQHPSLNEVIAFCKNHTDKNGVTSDDPQSNFPIIKTEECYTVSYPLAVIGNQRKDNQLINLAVKNLLARSSALADSTGIYQRTDGNGGRIYKNWSRGVAWYLLGYIRSYEQLKNHQDADLLKKEIIRAAKYVIQFQQKNGMWYCFLHEPETGLETSGTAGIAAALKYGYQIGVLDATAKSASDKATKALKDYLTPDGLLTGTAQVNKGGEILQRSGLRVISPYTLGFMGYLLAN